MENTNTSYQLIDQHKSYHQEALQAIVASLGDCNKDYSTVAIIGAQNTGKSTLLNNLFHTQFKVLKGEAGHRTTRGVILGKDFKEKLIIMDVEGNDSYESHLQGDQNYEKMVSSFALVGANVLLVNIFEKQLGQHSGSQYETLSIVMRICIDQFKQESPKTILFCLRDSNPNYTDEGECRRKVQQDVFNVWKSVWSGTKKSADFQKYQATPERFFSLEVAFLREFDPQYPEDFQEDVAKLRERFVNPTVDGYLFKKQKKQFNLPIQDLDSLLNKIWGKLAMSEQLNLPNQKVQLANYRCEEYSTQLMEDFEKDLDERASEVRNYQTVVEQLRMQFQQKTKNYSKQIVQKWLAGLLDKLHSKIRKVTNELMQQKEQSLQDQFKHAIDNLFFDLDNPNDNFKQQAEKVKSQIVEELVSTFRSLNYEIADRKVTIDKFTAILLRHIKEDVARRLKELQKEFQDEIRREMRLLVAKIMKSSFNLSFYAEVTRLYSLRKVELLQSYNERLVWARGVGGNANQLDEAEYNMVQSLKNECRQALEASMLQKLFEYFKVNFYFDQHQAKYDYNMLNDQKAIEIFSQAKEMTLTLVKTLNDFKLEPERRSSMILTDDIEDDDATKPLLESNSILAIQENFEKRAAEQYAAVVRKRNESHMKQVPAYLFVLIFYFIYDDIWLTYDEHPILHTLLLVLVASIGLIYAVGQGPIMRQMVQVLYEKFIELLRAGKEKIYTLRRNSPEKKKDQPQERKIE